ncbi:MAG: fliY [Clostridiales bacterium]|jgi:flagellar motor switch protein FliN/FliY|nr:fliY [Clostridiales bacterium]
MDGMLSQEEINALLNGFDEPALGQEGDSSSQIDTNKRPNVLDILTPEEIDATGEVSNISMGSAATTLFQLVNKLVTITTPTITITRWSDFTQEYNKPCVIVQIVYKEGISGSNIIVFQENDVRVITDLMMGGDGLNPPEDLTDIHMSAISEAMNQMMGSAATAMSQMLSKRIDISPPEANLIDMQDGTMEMSTLDQFLQDDFVKVEFDMVVGDLIHSKIMQLFPINFAKDIFRLFSTVKEEPDTKQKNTVPKKEPVKAKPEQVQNQLPPQQVGNQQMGYQMPPQQMGYQMPPQQMGYQMPPQQMGYPMQDMSMMGQNVNAYRDVNAQPAQFQAFSMVDMIQQKENIDLIMDVPLEVTVELGKTHKSIKEILEFSPGTIIELDRLAGEPIDVMVNGKLIAKGEVVVIDENFGIRITDILKTK